MNTTQSELRSFLYTCTRILWVCIAPVNGPCPKDLGDMHALNSRLLSGQHCSTSYNIISTLQLPLQSRQRSASLRCSPSSQPQGPRFAPLGRRDLDRRTCGDSVQKQLQQRNVAYASASAAGPQEPVDGSQQPDQTGADGGSDHSRGTDDSSKASKGLAPLDRLSRLLLVRRIRKAVKYSCAYPHTPMPLHLALKLVCM